MTSPGSVRTTLLTVLVSLVLPGSGHILAGYWKAGILWAVLRLLLPLAALTLMLQAPSRPAGLLLMVSFLLFPLCPAVHAAVLVRTRGRQARAPRPLQAGLILVVMVALLALFTFALRTSYAMAFRIPSASMAPTLEVGDFMLADLRASSRDFMVGDVVVFRTPYDRSERFVDRIVALGGDTVELRDRQVHLNGSPLAEPYAHHQPLPLDPLGVSPRDNMAPFLVPVDHVFVLGDERENSNDSRYFGPVRSADVVGRVAGIYFSFAGAIRWERMGRPVSPVGRSAQ